MSTRDIEIDLGDRPSHEPDKKNGILSALLNWIVLKYFFLIFLATMFEDMLHVRKLLLFKYFQLESEDNEGLLTKQLSSAKELPPMVSPV